MKHSISRRSALQRFLALGTLAASTPLFAQPIAVDPQLPAYSRTTGVSGNLSSIGSDTLNNLMTLWAEGFKSQYPNVKIQIEGKGSATAPPALIEGTAQLGPMSRPMKAAELDAFEKKYGYKPLEFKVAVDALAVFVHKDNPVKFIKIRHLDGIFSSTRKQGGEDVTKWGDVGLAGEWANKPISLFGRNSASGTYGFFKDTALKGGDASDVSGIGYSGIGYATSGVRAVNLEGSNGKAYEPTLENCLNGKYPLARYLYIYINKKPGQPLDTLQAEFLKFVASKAGQEVVVKDGYFPMPSSVALKELKKLEK
jgi:phosphate transport system substrate-binding protein